MEYGYDYGYNVGNSLATGVISSVLIILLLVVVISLVAAILMIIGQWKCFKKAGYQGWESLISGHNQFVNCSLAGVNPILVLVLLFGSVVTIIPVIGWLAYFGFLIYYQIVVGINTAKAFGKGIGFGIALAIPLSAPIAWFILGKDNIKYVGVKQNDNGHEDNVDSTEQTVQPVETVQPSNCSNCGAAINADDKFCMYCGKQL